MNSGPDEEREDAGQAGAGPPTDPAAGNPDETRGGNNAPSEPPVKHPDEPAFPDAAGSGDAAAATGPDDALTDPEPLDAVSDGVWDQGEIEVLDERPPNLPSRRSSGATGVVAAAMLGLGEVLEPEKTNVEIVQVDDQPLDPPPIKLDYSDVPPDEREPPDNKVQL